MTETNRLDPFLIFLCSMTFVYIAVNSIAYTGFLFLHLNSFFFIKIFIPRELFIKKNRIYLIKKQQMNERKEQINIFKILKFKKKKTIL